MLSGPLSGQALPPAVAPGAVERALEQSQPETLPSEPAPAVILPHSDSVTAGDKGATLHVRRIELADNDVLDASTLQELLDVGDGKDMTLEGLKSIANQVTAQLIEAGYLLMRAYVPQQEVVDGIVRLELQTGRLQEIRASGSVHHDQTLAGLLQHLKGDDSLKTAELEQPLLQMNDIRGLQVEAYLRPGRAAGHTDIELQVKEDRPYYLAMDIDNFGSEYTGEVRYGLSGEYDSLFKLGDRISVRSVVSEDDQQYLHGSYRLPIAGLGTSLAIGYTYSDYQLGSNLAPLDAEGGGDQLYAEIRHQYRYSRDRRVSFYGGLGWRAFEDELLGSTSSDDELVGIYVGLDGYLSDEWSGRTYYDLRLQQGLNESDTDDPLNSRLDGKGNALIASFQLNRYQRVPVLDSYAVLRAAGQVSNKRLLSPDLYGIGGMGTVRGYPLGDVSGDNAYLLSAEYVVPFPLETPVMDGINLKQVLSLFAFLDHGKVFIKSPQPGERDLSITGAGGGLRLNLPAVTDNSSGFSFIFAYGERVSGNQPSDGSNGIVYLGAQIDY